MSAPVDGGTSQGFGENPTARLPSNSWLIQTFGNYQPNGHTGVDYPVPEGTPVRAVAAGTVKHVGWYSGSYADNPYWIAPAFAGFVLVIDHDSFVGIYAHLSGSPVRVGQYVYEGQTVAYSGNTGGSTGPHLHFEILPNGWDFNNGMFGRINPNSVIASAGLAAQGGVTSTSEPIQEDDLSAEFERDVRAQLAQDSEKAAKFERDVRAQLQSLPSFERDVRADLAQKAQQITALTAVNSKLAELLADTKSLSIEDVRAAFAAVLVEGITVKIEVAK